VFIADIEAVDHATYCRLLDAANRHCGDLGAWTATLSADALSALQTRGFEPIDAERRARGCPTILVRPLANGTDWTLNGKSLIDMQQWDIRMLYSMSV
jgi:hypothetical protein